MKSFNFPPLDKEKMAKQSLQMLNHPISFALINTELTKSPIESLFTFEDANDREYHYKKSSHYVGNRQLDIECYEDLSDVELSAQDIQHYLIVANQEKSVATVIQQIVGRLETQSEKEKQPADWLPYVNQFIKNFKTRLESNKIVVTDNEKSADEMKTAADQTRTVTPILSLDLSSYDAKKAQPLHDRKSFSTDVINIVQSYVGREELQQAFLNNLLNFSCDRLKASRWQDELKNELSVFAKENAKGNQDAFYRTKQGQHINKILALTEKASRFYNTVEDAKVAFDILIYEIKKAVSNQIFKRNHLQRFFQKKNNRLHDYLNHLANNLEFTTREPSRRAGLVTVNC